VDYTLEFLRGHCHLALGQPEEARLAFERGLEQCGRQLHRTVLRGLAMDVDQPFLAAARRSIADRIGAGAIEPALREAWSTMARLRRPEAALVDLAQIHLDAATVGVGTDQGVLPAPTGDELSLCGGRLSEVYRAGSDLERSRRLAQLAISAHEPSRRKAELILRKAEALEQQAALAEILARSGSLLREGRFAEALAALDAAGEAGAAEPRVARQRALLLLRLEKFEEAQAVADTLARSTSPVAREFLARFPTLAFRQRIAAASRMLRAGDSASALAILEAAEPGDAEQAVELAYCRGFGLTMDAHRLRRAGDEAGARRSFAAAMDRVEPHVAAARSAGHSRLIDLYEALDKEIDHGS
jgi:tetratricopeptide (TPR) repeat protein